MRSIFLDTNIYSYASNDGDVVRLRTWLDGSGWAAVASMVNLVELARPEDRAQARTLVSALTRIARVQEDPPFTMLLADEFLVEVGRRRRAWVRPSSWASRARRLRTYRRKWRAVRASPCEAFAGLDDFNRLHRPREHALHEQQAQVAALQRQRNVAAVEVVLPPRLRQLVGDVIADRFGALPPAERFVRLVALEDWAAALVPTQRVPNDLSGWVEGHVTVSDERDLATFWLSDVQLRDVPHHAVRGLVRHLQPTRTVLPSNRNDLDIANWLLRADTVLTADRRFFDLLVQAKQQLRNWMPYVRLAPVGLLQRTGDLVPDVQHAITGAR